MSSVATPSQQKAARSSQPPAAPAVVFAAIFVAFVVPSTEAQARKQFPSISLDHEEEHLHGPIDQNQTTKRPPAVVVFSQPICVGHHRGDGRRPSAASRLACDALIAAGHWPMPRPRDPCILCS